MGGARFFFHSPVRAEFVYQTYTHWDNSDAQRHVNIQVYSFFVKRKDVCLSVIKQSPPSVISHRGQSLVNTPLPPVIPHRVQSFTTTPLPVISYPSYIRSQTRHTTFPRLRQTPPTPDPPSPRTQKTTLPSQPPSSPLLHVEFKT